MIESRPDSTVDDLGGCLLPSQYVDLKRKRPSLDGEYRLLFAVLEDAVRRYLINMKGQTPEQRKIFRETSRWFRTAHAADPSLFAFESVCGFLGIEPNRFRAGLVELQVREMVSAKQQSAA
jgi:hypothetical protein